MHESTEEEWRRKDLSACILADDPECLPKTGKVLFLDNLYIFLDTQVSLAPTHVRCK